MKLRSNSLMVIITLGMLTAISSISIDIYLPAFGIMADYFKVPVDRMGYSVTFFLLGMAIGQFFTGPVSDVFGRQLPLKIGLLVYVICSTCIMFTASFWVFLALRFIQGLAGSTTQVVARALVNDLYSGEKAVKIFTILQIIMGISPILSPFVGGLVSVNSGWQVLFLIMALASGIGLISCYSILPNDRMKTRFNGFKPYKFLSAYRKCIKHPGFINYAMVRAMSNSAAFVLMTSAPYLMMQKYGLKQTSLGLLFTGLAIGVILAGLLNTILLKHYHVKLIMKSAILFQITIGVLLIIAIFFKADLFFLFPLLFSFISMLGLILPNATALYIQLFPSNSGAGSAVVGTLSYLSAFLITCLSGLIPNNTAYPMAIIMLACAVMSIVCLSYSRQIRQQR